MRAASPVRAGPLLPREPVKVGGSEARIGDVEAERAGAGASCRLNSSGEDGATTTAALGGAAAFPVGAATTRRLCRVWAPPRATDPVPGERLDAALEGAGDAPSAVS